jgi:hypothetical protein
MLWSPVVPRLTQMKALQELGGFSNWQQHWKEWAALRALGGKYTDPK